MKKMSKDEFISRVDKRVRFPKHITATLIDELFAELIEVLAEGYSVQFVGFGTFEPKLRAARMGRNPHTNEPVPIPARVVPTFKPGSTLKNAVTKL